MCDDVASTVHQSLPRPSSRCRHWPKVHQMELFGEITTLNGVVSGEVTVTIPSPSIKY